MSIESAAAGFRAAFGLEPAGVWSAPGRVNLIGEHTDYNEGFVLPIAIGHRAWVALGRRADGIARVASSSADGAVELAVDEISAATASGWSAYLLGTLWGLRQVTGETLGGFDAYVDSDVPVGAGLSSSAALECSLALGLAELWGVAHDGEALVRAACLAENEIVGAPTGILDQSAAVFAEQGHALFLDCRDQTREQVPFSLESAGLRLVVANSRVEHAHVAGGYASRREACQEAARTLGARALRDVTLERLEASRSQLDPVVHRRARHVVTEDERVLRVVELLRSEGPAAIGSLLVESHHSMRDDFEITVPEVDALVESALDGGALGARMTGGGFGGSVIALVRAEDLDVVVEHLLGGQRGRGYPEPDIFVVEPGPGARRDL